MASQLIAETSPQWFEESEYERIDGQLVRREVPGRKHAQIQGAIYRLLWDQCQTQTELEVNVEWSLVRPGTADRAEPDYLTADVLVAQRPFETAANDHLLPPAFLAVEVVSPQQQSLFDKAERYVSWGVAHVWIVDPATRNAFEYHGGREFLKAKDQLQAGSLVVRLQDIFPFR